MRKRQTRLWSCCLRPHPRLGDRVSQLNGQHKFWTSRALGCSCLAKDVGLQVCCGACLKTTTLGWGKLGAGCRILPIEENPGKPRIQQMQEMSWWGVYSIIYLYCRYCFMHLHTNYWFMLDPGAWNVRMDEVPERLAFGATPGVWRGWHWLGRPQVGFLSSTTTGCDMSM